MMVTFISRCEKKALARTRRVLDAFADRIGDNAWQTVITEEGLMTVKKMLRKTASKNTAVSCHWIRSRSRTELVWVVGNKDKFNAQGVVPVNATAAKLVKDDTNDWRLLPVIRALTCVSALLHDWGKANTRFQQKLNPQYKGTQADSLRHEWVSCLLLRVLVVASGKPEQDAGWLGILKSGSTDETVITGCGFTTIKQPLAKLPGIGKLIAWLILSHHRMPLPVDDYSGSECDNLDSLLGMIDQTWGYANDSADGLENCLTFSQGLLFGSNRWRSQLKRWAGKLLEMQPIIEQSLNNGSYRVVLHHARLCLMLGDHYFSSLDLKDCPRWSASTGLIANTQKNKLPKQFLDQHLVGVYECAKRTVSKLPVVENGLEQSYNTAALKRKSPSAFAWQDIAAAKTRDWSIGNGKVRKGFFAVNMASTGCGKTYANAKVMMALSNDGDSLRYVLALGLRTLTLQTGDEYRERIFRNSDGTDLGVLIGSKAVAELHNARKESQIPAESELGSESTDGLLAASDEVVYERELSEEGLTTILQRHKDKQMLYAPVLVCTIDHIISATESVRGGRHILPGLRLLSSDLVIDEVDDFTDGDLIAIGRLIHLAGMLGRKVMISSATIPPALAEGYFNTYREGWELYCKTRNASTRIGCAWIDEFTTVVEDVASQGNDGSYKSLHERFIEKRVSRLQRQPVRRKAEVVDCRRAMDLIDEPLIVNKRIAWFETILAAAMSKHRLHNILDDTTDIRISLGVVRMANIKPCVQLARYLMECECPDDFEIRVMAYHSKQVLLLRHAQEKYLDGILKRKEKYGEPTKALHDELVRRHLDTVHRVRPDVRDVLFILVASPVEEVGRDHDFDWAIIEPSSYRSIIQMAGRVMRHRNQEVEQTNIGILQYNWRTLKYGDKPREPRFCMPGFEASGELRHTGNHAAMKSHDLHKVVDGKLIGERLDATPRIQKSPKGSKTLMAQLEHAVMESLLTDYDGAGPETLQGYVKWYWYLTALPQKLNRFRNSRKTIQLYRVANDAGETWFTERNAQGKFEYTNTGEFAVMEGEYQITTEPLTEKLQERLWMRRDYLQLLSAQSELCETSLNEVAKRYGEISFEDYGDDLNRAFTYNDQFGLFEKDE